MAELAHSDLPAATLALFANTTAAQAAIDAALAAARRFCGWHVSPVRTDVEVTVDGPGGQVLSLPTLNLISVDEVDDDGSVVASGDLRVSRLGLVRKRSGGCWSSAFGSVTATITHGFTESEAADWRAAIIAVVDSRGRASARDSADLKRKRVDDVEYEWFESLVSNDRELAAKLAQFRILPRP